MHPPNANPSKNWWKDSAAISGLMVHGLFETPNESPIMTEWETIPSSKICVSFRYLIQFLILVNNLKVIYPKLSDRVNLYL